MCPHLKDGVCELRKEDGPVKEDMRLYYCGGTLRPEAYKECPVFKEGSSS